MPKEGRDLVKEALADAKSLKEAAVESAKKELVETLTPAIRKLLDENLKGVSEERGNRKGYDKNRQLQVKPPFDSGKGVSEEVEENLTLEDALQELFPADGVEENKMVKSETVEEKVSHGSHGSKGKVASSANEAKACSSGMEEQIEISEAELRKVYQAALQTEVQVKKGFSDMVGGGELEQAHKEHGIEDNMKQKDWDKETPPHAQKDWIPEARQLQGMLKKGLAENKALRENLRKAVTMIETLGKKLHEVNLFNAKVLHVNKILNSGARLTTEQKTFVMESIDKARSISEVKMVFETIVGSIQTQATINENRTVRPPKANAGGARTTGTPNQRVLSESVDRGQSTQFSRIQQLAGLLK